MILSTHIVDDVADLCPHMAIISKGRVLLDRASRAARGELDGQDLAPGRGPRASSPRCRRSLPVISTRLQSGRTVVRAYARRARAPGFEAVEPELEDVYFSAVAGHLEPAPRPRPPEAPSCSPSRGSSSGRGCGACRRTSTSWCSLALAALWMAGRGRGVRRGQHRLRQPTRCTSTRPTPSPRPSPCWGSSACVTVAAFMGRADPAGLRVPDLPFLLHEPDRQARLFRRALPGRGRDPGGDLPRHRVRRARGHPSGRAWTRPASARGRSPRSCSRTS